MTHPERARGWRDPLIQFLLIGALLFVADHAFGTGASSARRIVLGSSDIGQLKQIYLQQWQREPDAQQLQALIEARVREEIFYREAVARGLDQDDVIVRRRLAQKMDYLAQQDIAAPTDDDRDNEKACGHNKLPGDSCHSQRSTGCQTADNGEDDQAEYVIDDGGAQDHTCFARVHLTKV